MKYVALAAINAPVDGQVVRLVVGQEFESLTVPVDLLRAGYVRPVEVRPVEVRTAEDVAAVERVTAVTPKRRKK